MLESLFNHAARLSACNYIKRRLVHRSFPVNIAKIFRTVYKLFLQNTAGGYFWTILFFNLQLYDLFSLIIEWETANWADDTTAMATSNAISSFELCSKNTKWFHDKSIKANSKKLPSFLKARGQMWIQVLREISFVTLHPKTSWSYIIYRAKL